MATLQEIIQYSKANPNSAYAQKAAELIKNGSFDAQAQKEGIDLSWAGRPKYTAPDNSLEGQLRANSSYQSQVGAEQVAGIKKIGSSINKGAEDISTGMQQSAQGGFMNQLKGLGSTIKGAAEAGFGTISGVARTIFAPFTPAIEKVAPTVAPAIVQAVTLGAITPERGKAIADAVAPKIEEWTKQHPDATTLANDILNTVLLAVGGKVSVGEGVLSKEGFSVARTGLINDVKSSVSNAKGLLRPNPVDATAKITEMISPKATVKEARLAQTQGRLIEGKKPTLFKSGTEDTILPSAKTKAATQTIIENVPNAQKMSPTELYKAVDTKITETATKLRPQMEATPIKQQTIEKLNADWETIKKQQMLDAPATEEPNVLKRQKKFEAFLQKSGSESYADLWDTAIEYDKSIPESVKKANSLSSESLQLQKDEWLQNRQILSDAIDKSSRPEFKTMSDLYEARNGLLSQTKVANALPSKFNQWIKDNPKKWVVVETALGIEGLRLLGIDPMKLVR